MIFGDLPIDEAEGTLLAHSLKLPDGRLRKGSRLTADDLARLRAAGVHSVVAARLEVGDLTEDKAAERLAEGLASEFVGAAPPATGRVNFFAGHAGLFQANRAVVDRLNTINPGITLATLPDLEPVESGRMVATVKIIPLAVPGAAVAQALKVLHSSSAFSLAPYVSRRVVLIQTELPGVKASVLDKTRRITEERLAPSRSKLVAERRCLHRSDALTAALEDLPEADLVLVFGASAVIDRGDVIPSAIERAGGIVEQFGMPVDPGNLLLLGRIEGRRIIGAPGCARSSKENGFDWVLNRLLADLEVLPEDICHMGVGGLLMEIASRPSPREASEKASDEDGDPVVDIIVLAAGLSSRMGGGNKLLARFDGETLIRRTARLALASRRAGSVRVVTGHMAKAIEAELSDLDVDLVRNPDYAEGLSTSLKAGFAASRGADAVLVLLADQPRLDASHLDALIDSFARNGRGKIVAAGDRGKRRNPVLLSTDFAEEVGALTGDVGAAPILAANPDLVSVVEIGEAASLDVDTPESLAAAGGNLAPAVLPEERLRGIS